MKTRKTLCIALFEALLLIVGSAAVRAQAGQQAADKSQTDSDKAKRDKDTKARAAEKSASADSSTAPKNASSNKPATSTAVSAAAARGSAAASKATTAQKTPPANSAGMVWVNTDSGVYHKPGTRWYGKTKKGKYMTEADAQKAGYRAAGKE